MTVSTGMYKMHKVDKLVLSEVVKGSLMKEVTLHLDIKGWTRQWGKEVKGSEGGRKAIWAGRRTNAKTRARSLCVILFTRAMTTSVLQTGTQCS